jgi:hypothetical protein
MSATLTLTQTRTTLPTGFEVENVVTNGVDIPNELFVYTQNNDEFSHVATLYDLAYPIVNDAQFDYYRQDNATKVYDNATTALEFSNYTKARVDTLVKNYNDGDLVDFPGVEVTNMPIP